MDLWYAVPAIIAISLVYAATRHEADAPDPDSCRPRGRVDRRLHVRRFRRIGVRQVVGIMRP